MSVVCHVCGGQMESIEYCCFCNPDGLDITEEAALHGKVVEAAIAWRDVVSGTLTVPPPAHVDVEQALGSAVDALQRHKAASVAEIGAAS